MAVERLKGLKSNICALATPPGRSALAVVRLSGPSALDELARLSPKARQLEHRKATRLILKKPTGEWLDEVVATYFQAPRSFTGEDLVEICCHGNPEIVKQILGEIVSHETRLAEPGEFSRRAVLNGKMKLSELEALSQVIHAKSPESISAALRSKLRALGLSLSEAQEEIRQVLAEVQARLDFPEHEVGDLEILPLSKRLYQLKKRLKSWIQMFRSHKRQLEGELIVIAGPPNSGKSSLFNALLGADKAIVFDQPGTTRDQIESSFDLAGREMSLVDTAGLHESTESIEKLGMERTEKLMAAADLVIWVSPLHSSSPEVYQSLYPGKKWILVASKMDLGLPQAGADVALSVKTGQGLKELRHLIGEALSSELSSESLLTSERQADLTERAVSALEESAIRLESGEALEWCAQSLLEASEALGEILGEVPHQEVLDKILSKFCIGK